MESLVVPITNILPFGIYEAVIEKKNCFVKLVHINNHTYNRCNFVKPKRFRLKFGNLRYGAKVTGYVENSYEVKTLQIKELRHVGDKYVFLTPECDAFYYEKPNT